VRHLPYPLVQRQKDEYGQNVLVEDVLERLSIGL
jgi:hypothetical protein